MSLYWQQAVQNKKPQPAAQSHVATGNNPAETWQNVNLGQPQNNYWSHDQANQVPQNYQQSSQPAQTNNYNQSYQHVPPPSAYSLPPPVQHIPLLNSNQTQHVPQEVQYQGYVGQDGQYYQNYDYYHTGYNAAQQEQQYYLPQVASLSSIPEFESVDFPTATAASPAVEFAPAQPQSVQEHPVVSLPAEQVDHPAKQSSQVTPESTYSVDTFNSNHSKEEKKEDEWDDWEQTPRESVHEKSPYAVESTQSEPIPSVHSDPSRESTFSLEHQAAHEAEKHVEVQPVAQVAPIIKNHPEPEHPVARVGPVSQIPVEPNVRRVAPTRPIQAAVPLPEPVVEIRPEFVTTAQSTSSQSTAAPPEVSPVLASAVTEERPRLSPRPEDRSHLVAPEVEEPRTTPDTLQLEHIGQAQATSTPNDSVQEVERVVERRTSVSSIRSGIQPIATSGQVQNGEHSDSTQGSVAFSRGGVRSSYQERYRGVREKYIDVRTAAAESMHRLDRSRVDTPKLVRGNPLTEAAGGRRSVIQISSRNKADISNSSYTAHDKGNMSNFSQPDPSLNESMDISTHGGAGYGEDFVDASRRSRLNRNRPPSRAKSDIVDDMPYHHRGYSNQHHHHHGRHAYDNRGYPVHPQYYPYQQMARLSGRQSTGGMQYPNEYYQQQAMMYQHPRPQSTYDARSIERFQRNGGNMVPYDVYASRPEDEEDESFSEESDVVDEEGESEDEMRNYNMPAIPRGVNNSFSSYPMASHARAPIFGPDEIYNLGLINLELKVAESVFRKFRVPREFASLEPEEKVAYLFFAVVYNKLSPVGVQGFRNMFKREYYNFICNGDTKDNALRKICNSMKEEYMAKNIQRQQKAYEASQKQLFSDDRDSADGLSDRASVYEKDDDRASDILSIDQRAPQKFRTPHAFLKFGPGGKKITVIPDHSVSVVYIDDVKTLLRDNHSRRLVDAAQNFKGPLLNDRTPSHSVLLYIQNQIMRIQHSDLAKSNPHSCDVVDCTLLWRLLETCVKQQGRVTGPDIAQLLIAVGPSSSRKALSNHREKSATPSQESIRTIQPDQKAYEMFTAYLLGGHVDEAVDWAVKSGLHADAMILVRRIFAGNEKKLADIEAKFLATRPTSNPVMTLVAVASGQPAPVLTNPPNDEEGSWRSHAAIVLANLNTSHAKETVYRLGCVLAKREYHAAADFCFLAVSLLSNFEGVNVFQRPASTEEDADSRQYVSLIHASLPDDEWDSTTCRFGFSLTDLHATEIFDYAIKMTAPAGFVSPLNNSVEFQQKRLQYAQLLAGFGSFNAEAFRYLLSVVTSIWYYYHLFSVTDLTVLADLADSLRMYAADDAADTTWIENLRMMIINLQQKQNDQGPVSQPENAHQQTVPVVFQEQIQSEPVYQQQYQEPEPNPMSSRSRTDSLAIEARDWHAERQEPIQMSPRGSTASPSSFRRDSIAPQNDVMSPLLTEFQTPRGRMDSISSQQGQPMSYGEQLCQTQQQLYGQANNHQHNDYESATTESVDTTSPESSPIRSQPTTSSISAAEWHPTPEPPKSQPPSVMQQSVSAQQPRQQQTQAPTSSKPQENGGMKKSGSKSTGWMGSFVNKVRSVVPGSDDMRLPDDSNPSIVWDAAQNKWVGAGIEEQPAVAPPPAAMSLATAAAPEAPPAGGVAGGLRHARGGGASRYVATGGMGGANVGAAPVNVVPQQAPPAMPLFNFIPMMPDDADAVDPFSGASNPTVHGADQEQPQ